VSCVDYASITLDGFNYDDVGTMHVWNAIALAVLVVLDHIHYLNTSGIRMVKRDDASLELHGWQSKVIAITRTLQA
jgi:hypothetical protein